MAIWKVLVGRHRERETTKEGYLVRTQFAEAKQPTRVQGYGEGGQLQGAEEVSKLGSGCFESDRDYSGDPEKFTLVSGKPGQGGFGAVGGQPGPFPSATKNSQGDPLDKGTTTQRAASQLTGEKDSTATVTDGDDGDDGLESLTVAELKEAAESEEIDLSGAHRKDDIIAAIRLGRGK